MIYISSPILVRDIYGIAFDKRRLTKVKIAKLPFDRLMNNKPIIYA